MRKFSKSTYDWQSGHITLKRFQEWKNEFYLWKNKHLRIVQCNWKLLNLIYPIAANNSQRPEHFHLSVFLTRTYWPLWRSPVTLFAEVHTPSPFWSYLSVYNPPSCKYTSVNVWSYNGILLLEGCQHITTGSCKLFCIFGCYPTNIRTINGGKYCKWPIL